jgi:methylglutaconyl-CoA hydratase
MALVEIERDGAVARVWLNRPEQHNALSPELTDALASLCATLAQDDAIRVVVLGGRGPSFCAGADIGGMKASSHATFAENLADAERLGRAFAAIADLPRPVVGRLHGNVFGGGVGLACMCDIAIATDDARFGFTEARLGIVPALISPYVIRRLGDRHARELLLTAERFGPDVAMRVGLVHHVAPTLDLDTVVDERVGELLKSGPLAQRRIKAMLHLYGDSSFDEYRSAMARTLAEIRSGDEAREGLSAFFDKRRPRWIPE